LPNILDPGTTIIPFPENSAEYPIGFQGDLAYGNSFHKQLDALVGPEQFS
jgi:hypothetical protein